MQFKKLQTLKICQFKHVVKIKKIRSSGNLFMKYFRKLFTMIDGTPLIISVDISTVEECQFTVFVYDGKGQGGTFDFKKTDSFNWKTFLVFGLKDEELTDILSSPITSVKLKPSKTPATINTAHNRKACSNAVEWSFNLGRQDGRTVTVQPKSNGKRMKYDIHAQGDFALAGHPRNRKIAGPPEMQANGTTFLYGGMEDSQWRQRLEEDLHRGKMQARILPLSLDNAPSFYADIDKKIMIALQWLNNLIADQTPSPPMVLDFSDQVPWHIQQSGSSSSTSRGDPRLPPSPHISTTNGNSVVTTALLATTTGRTPASQINDNALASQQWQNHRVGQEEVGAQWQNRSGRSVGQEEVGAQWGNWRSTGWRTSTSSDQWTPADQAGGSRDWH